MTIWSSAQEAGRNGGEERARGKQELRREPREDLLSQERRARCHNEWTGHQHLGSCGVGWGRRWIWTWVDSSVFLGKMYHTTRQPDMVLWSLAEKSTHLIAYSAMGGGVLGNSWKRESRVSRPGSRGHGKRMALLCGGGSHRLCWSHSNVSAQGCGVLRSQTEQDNKRAVGGRAKGKRLALAEKNRDLVWGAVSCREFQGTSTFTAPPPGDGNGNGAGPQLMTLQLTK